MSNPPKAEPLGKLLLTLGLAVALFDLCFWKIKLFGISTALFFPLLAQIILANRTGLPRHRSSLWILGLLLGSCFAGAIELGLSTVIVLFVLTLALAGDTYFTKEESPWGRGLAQLVAWLRAPGRVFWLGGRLLTAAFGNGLGWLGRLMAVGFILIPALVLSLIFGLLLSSGNAVFGEWTSSFFTELWHLIASTFDLWRVLLWIFIGGLILPLLRPVDVSSWWWKWTEKLPRLPEMVPTEAAILSSALVLLVLNGMFFVANGADLLFLWSHEALPKGVTYSAYVHQGVATLICTVLLSALVLLGIFQQAMTIAQRRELKILAYVWVGQNLFLLLSVLLRLKRYTDAYSLTVERLGVGIFLVLVAMGFGLLTVKIVRDKSLSWLVGGCVLAAFGTLYVVQFLDLAGWSSNYNVARWERDRSRPLDFEYIQDAGMAGWPALRRAQTSAPNIEHYRQVWEAARNGVEYTHQTGLEWRYWREFSLRAYWNRWALEE